MLAWHAQVYSYRHILYSSGYISIISIVVVFLIVVVVIVVVVVAFVIVVTVLPRPAAIWNGRRIRLSSPGTHRYNIIVEPDSPYYYHYYYNNYDYYHYYDYDY